MKKLLALLLFVSNAYAAPATPTYELGLVRAIQTGNSVEFSGSLSLGFTPGAFPVLATFISTVDFGDGQSATVGPTSGFNFTGERASSGITVEHVYAPGSFTALMTLSSTGSWTSVSFNNITQTFSYTPQTLAFNFERAFPITVVPEPETYALMLAGLALMGWRKQWLKK